MRPARGERMSSWWRSSLVVAAFAALIASASVNAETGREGWLRYAPLPAEARISYESLPATVVVVGDSAILNNASDEIVRGVHGMLGRTLRVSAGLPNEGAIIVS